MNDNMPTRNHITPVTAVLNDPWNWDDERSGLFRVDDDGRHILLTCPCNCGTTMHLPINVKIDRHWLWDGNRDVPSLDPSIRDMGGCHFHGFLKQGVWTFCGDSGVGAER